MRLTKNGTFLKEEARLSNSLQAQCIITWIRKFEDLNEMKNFKMTRIMI